MIGARVKRARQMAGMSQQQLAAACGVSKMAVSKYERDAMTPSSSVLLAMARALGASTAYLLRPDTLTLGNVEYRKRASLGKRALDSIKGSIHDQAERFLATIDLFPQPVVREFAVPDALPRMVTSMEGIEDVAQQVRDAWQLGHNPIASVTDELEARGIIVIVAVLGDVRGFDGLAAMAAGRPLIAVGDAWPGDRQRFTLAHELGHLVLDGRLTPDIDVEQACNRFAGAFLAPADAVVRALGGHRTFIESRELYELKHEFGLSMAAWVYRARDVGVISSDKATTLHRMFGKHGWKQREPGKPVASESPGLHERLVLRAHAEDLISTARAAELMGESTDAFRNRLQLEYVDAAGR